MANFRSLFIKDYSSITAPLRTLLLENSKWVWTDEHQNAFSLLKSRLTEDCLLNYFNPNLGTELVCDASPYSLCAMLTRIGEDGTRKIISYVSRSLTDVEKNYGKLNEKHLQFYFAVTNFTHIFLVNILRSLRIIVR